MSNLRLHPNSKPRPGPVYLIGAGPGDAKLITVRGLERLRSAQVVLYDRLVAPALLGEAPPFAERICVGKAPGRERLDQKGIEALMIERATAGKTVVRLKGGDPFVFGRGGEEALALKDAGIPFEVVPGISSPIAVPEAAGIPVTHRGVSGAFAVWTAHRSPGSSVQAIDAPTQVILMGTATLNETIQQIRAMGRPPSTPVAVIRWGATVRQQAVFGTLEDIAEQVQSAGIGSPATIIVGEVVGVGQQLAAGLDAALGGPQALANTAAHPWAELFGGKRVALTRKIESDPLCERLEMAGAEAAPLPCLDADGSPAREVIGCMVDMILEEMIDAALVHSRRALGALGDFLEDLRPDIVERVHGFPIYLVDKDRAVPVAHVRETASEELIV